MINLNSTMTLPNAARVGVLNVHADDDNAVLYATVELRTTAATNHVVSSQAIVVRNGLTDKLSRGTLTANGPITDALQKTQGGLDLATGYTDAVNAWRSASTPAARKTALEAWMLTAGVLDSTLAGS